MFQRNARMFQLTHCRTVMFNKNILFNGKIWNNCEFLELIYIFFQL